MQTVNCHHIFCKSCVLDVPNPITICPMCRENVPAGGFVELQIANKFVLRRLNGLHVLCPYHKPKTQDDPPAATAVPGRAVDGQDSEPPLTRRRVEPGSEPGPGCSWKGSYADLSKHLASCEWCLVACPHGCGEEMRRPQVDEHLLACLLSFKECDICYDKVRPAMMAEHDRVEAQRHVKILLKQRKEGVEVRKEIGNLKASLNARLEAVERALGSAQVTDAVWIVKDMAAVRQQHPKGSKLQSNSFRLGSVPDISLGLFPNGEQDSPEGRYGLFVFVKEESPRLLKLTVKVGEEETGEMTHCFIPGRGRGWPSFGSIQNLPEAGELQITVHLLGASVLVSER